CNGDDEVWAYMCVHRGGGARCKVPVVNAGAGIFRGNSCGSDRRRRLRTNQKLDVQHIIRTRAYVVDPVCVRTATKGERGKTSWLGMRWRAFLLVPYLLRDRGAREGNGDAVVSMSMVERAVAGWQSQMNDNHGLILQHYVMKRLVLNEYGLNGHRRRGILRRKDKGRKKENHRVSFRSHSSCIPPWAKRLEQYATSVFTTWHSQQRFGRDLLSRGMGGTYTLHSMHECENKVFAK